MARGCVALLIALLTSSSASAQAPTHRIEYADHQAVTASIGYELRTENFAVSRWLAYVAEPPELPSQIKIKVAAEPKSKLLAEKGQLGRKLRLFDVPVANPTAGSRLLIRQDISAVLRSRKLVPLKPEESPPAVPALTAAERKYYLAASNRIDFDKPAFKQWLVEKKLTRAKVESPLDYASRVLGVIRADFAYRYDPSEDKRASASCSRPTTDCGGMTILLVAAMRANDIPARALVGRFALARKPRSSPAETEYDQPHVRAEFYVPGVGWVPVDPAFANTDRERPIAEFIGRDAGDLLVLHVDFDLRLPVFDREQVAVLLQLEPFIWAVGRGKLDVTLGPSRWDVKTVPLAANR